MRISAMRDLKGALERPLGAHHVIETDSPATVGGDSSDYHHASGTTVALRAAEAEAALPEILQRYAIAAARSADLAD